MCPQAKIALYLLILSTFSTLNGCGVLFPEKPDRIVVTKLKETERPILLDATCPEPPSPPPKPDGHNTLSKDAADYFATLDSWAMACRDLNEAIEAILRPSTEANKTEPKPTEGNP